MSLARVFDRTVELMGRMLPFTRPALNRAIGSARLARRAAYYWTDLKLVYRYMRWVGDYKELTKLESELFFQYHKIEKGLCMPGPKRFFGVEPARKILVLVRKWELLEADLTAPVYRGAIEAMHAYREAIGKTVIPAAVQSTLIPMLDKFLSERTERVSALSTPYQRMSEIGIDFESFGRLMQCRRSVRSYSTKSVPIDDITACIEVAQFCPSACNRQPWKVHIYQHKEKIDELLKLQSGNNGFGHQLNTLLIIAADMNAFFDGSERHEPYIDGGLFTMSLILALQAKGISSCCLNWCVKPQTDAKAHEVGDIPESHRIIMYLAIGIALDDVVVPRSARKGANSVCQVH